MPKELLQHTPLTKTEKTQIPAFEALHEQPRVREFFRRAFEQRRLSHAYLFVGAPGSGKIAAAEVVAKSIVCPHGGDGTCEDCIRVSHHTHPDVHWYKPQSASGYLIGQVREIISDVMLAPIKAQNKVYVLDRADLLRTEAANALLKTIEEPPRDAIFILCARSTSTVLPTICSRCQVVPFRTLSEKDALSAVMRKTAASQTEARVALAVTGTPSRALDFLASPSRREVRRLMVEAVGDTLRCDSWDILGNAREIVAEVKIPLGTLQRAQEEALETHKDFLEKKVLKEVEKANKRELTVRERSGMMEALAAAESLLRDVLVRCENISEPIVNEDVADVVDRLASRTYTRGVIRALAAIQEASFNLEHMVTPQLVVETMLLAIKEALTCPPLYR